MTKIVWIDRNIKIRTKFITNKVLEFYIPSPSQGDYFLLEKHCEFMNEKLLGIGDELVYFFYLSELTIITLEADKKVDKDFLLFLRDALTEGINLVFFKLKIPSSSLI
jgi:hypothetical protein